MSDMDARELALQLNLASVRDRIQKATVAAAAPQEPTLIVVTKFHPAQDVLRLRRHGVIDVGENRDQEAAAKAREVADKQLRWHFIGQLQSNKAKSVVQYAHSVHSLDRASLITSLGKAMAVQVALDGRQRLECFIQVDLSDLVPTLNPDQVLGQPWSRGGAAPSEVMGLAEQIALTPELKLAGVMSVAPLGGDAAAAFEILASISAALVLTHPEATGISAGMSHDLEQAIAAGATHLRVGSDILGARPTVG